MFRVKDVKSETQVFTLEDPRRTGYKGDIEEGVSLDYDREDIFLWPDGADLPDPCLGRSRENPKNYKVFKYQRDIRAAGYDFVSIGLPFESVSWRDYVRIRLNPPNPDETDQEDWYNYLDKVDDEARRLNKRSPWPESPPSLNRDDVAAWIAKQHFITDVSVREIWYLHQGSPPNEIRLLEISDRITGAETKVEPIDFGLNVDGAAFRLCVADVSSDQLEELAKDATNLPDGWHMDGHLVWRRRPA